MKKSLLIITALLMLSACASSVNVGFDKENYDQGKTAYIVIGASNNVSNEFPVSNVFHFKNQQGQAIVLYVNGVQSFMIPPGDYFVTWFVLKGSSYSNNVTKTINIDFDKAVEGSFSVSAGDAIYLGHVDTIITGVKKNIYREFANMGAAYASDIEYTTGVTNNFDKLDLHTFEAQAEKAVTPEIMKWRKL